VGATLAVGHAEGGSAWLAGRRSAAAELSPFLASLPRRLSGFARKPAAPTGGAMQVARVGAQRTEPPTSPASAASATSSTSPGADVRESGTSVGAPAREGSGSLAEDSLAKDPIGDEATVWKTGATAMALADGSPRTAPEARTALALAADGRRPAARLRREIDRPSRPVEHMGDRVSGILPPSAPRLEPPPLAEATAPVTTAAGEGVGTGAGVGAGEATIVTGAARTPLAAPLEAPATSAPAERPHASGPRRLSIDEDAPLPLDESGGETAGNRPLGLVE
jgi:hypothetical protein